MRTGIADVADHIETRLHGQPAAFENRIGPLPVPSVEIL